MIIVKALPEDAAAILKLQKLAYKSEAELHDDFSIPPLVQSIGELEAEFSVKTILKAEEAGRLVGSVRAWEKEGTCYIERLIVQPDLQGRGIGTELMGEIENAFPSAVRFELFTGHKSRKNIRFYSRLGYAIFRNERISDKLTFVFMQKAR